MLLGKKLSILGDSISTYIGISNNGNINSSIANNTCFYKPPFPLEKTYWQILAGELGLELCVNNSYSGGNLSGINDLTSGVNRASELSREIGEIPDIIIVFIGINDLGRGVGIEAFYNDYVKTLSVIKEKYPCATVCCVNIPDRDPFLKKRAELFNSAIGRAAKNFGDGVFIADLFSSRLKNDFYYMNTVDGLHPDEDGMKIIAEIIGKAIKDYFELNS